MNKYILLIISGFLIGPAFGQSVEKTGGTAAADINKAASVPLNTVAAIGGTIVPGVYANCKEIKDNHPDAKDGIYNIDPDGEGEMEAFDCYCDMTTDGGGWTLVLLSNRTIAGCPRPYWIDAVNNVNLNGTLSADITLFDLFLGVRNWNFLGTIARLDMGESPSNLSHRAYYTFSLDPDNYYALVMSDESVTIHDEETTRSPGMYTYHNGRPLTTRDADHDAYSSNCSNNFGYSAWWYGACWSGSFWGGGGAVYQDAPYWTGNGSEYFDYGSIWLR